MDYSLFSVFTMKLTATHDINKHKIEISLNPGSRWERKLKKTTTHINIFALAALFKITS